MDKAFSHPVRIYSDRSHYSRKDRGQLSALLRPFWKDSEFDDVRRQAMYGISDKEVALATSLSEADLAVLPMTWNHYMFSKNLNAAAKFIQEARRHDLPVLSYVSGDEGVKVPREFDDVWIVRCSGSNSSTRPRQLAQPVFFKDPYEDWPEFDNEKYTSTETGRPRVGFCGQASRSRSRMVCDFLRIFIRNLRHHLGFRLQEPQPLCPPSWIRARVLRALSASQEVEADFILRNRYRGGASKDQERHDTTREFYRNIARNDYTVCVRGGGNFSKRFYETLAMGRIPILIDTDCLLPFEELIPWGSRIVRIFHAERHQLPDILRRHYENHGSGGLIELKRNNRRLWEEWLTFGSFHRRVLGILLNPYHRIQRERFTPSGVEN